MAKLLVVEPDAQQRASFRETFEKAEYEVIEAESASAAVDACATDHPDVVLLDPYLGRFLGLTKGKWVAEASHRCGSARIVVLADEKDQGAFEAIGPDAVVSRDAKPEDLIATVSSLLAG